VGIFDRIADQLGELIAPDDVRAHVELGAALLEQNDLEAAVRELGLALAMRPDHARAAWLLGMALARRGDLDGAEQALGRAVGLRPDAAEAHVALGETLRRKGRLDEAQESFRRALAAGLADALLRGELYRGLGAIHLARGRDDKAVRELRKAAAALPDDGETQVLLGRALGRRGDLDGARLCLERAAAAPEASDEVLAALGEVYRRLGRSDEARAAFERIAAADRAGPASIEAALGLSALALAAGDRDGAQARAGAATRAARAPADVARAFVALARTLLDPDAALAAYQSALAASDSDDGQAREAILDEAIRFTLGAAALAGGEAGERLHREAARLGEARLVTANVRLDGGGSEDAAPTGALADALAAVALGRVGEGRLDEAAALAERARSTREGELAVARVALARGDRPAATRALRRAVELAPTGDGAADVQPQRLLAEIYRGEHAPVADDLYAILVAAHARLQRERELSDLAARAASLVETIDRPLLLTVMGEFNAGKSTFVNALVGEEVAPMGITPTTATINVLKYGAERGGRVVYLDERVKHVAWHEVGPLLRGLDEDEARRIRFVEVLYPLETLQRVNVVDTPGLNSIRPEHEATARGFIAQADAVIWLFSCRQPGTASERDALERVRGEGKKALGVVNMIDRLEPGQLDEVLAHLRGGFGELVEALVPLSAREALYGRDDKERLRRSNRDELERTLAERFFDRARAIKRTQAARRLGDLLDEARRRVEALREAGPREPLGRARVELGRSAERFVGRFLVEERLALHADLEALYAAAALEVLDFVRPRRWVFGSNEASPADRDFLVGLVEQQLAALVAGSHTRVADEARRTAGALRAIDDDEAERLLGEELRLLDEQVYGRYQAFARGFLRGGRVDDFFLRVLPRLELGEHVIQKALARDMPALDVLEEELVAPLGAWSRRFLDENRARLSRLAGAEELRRFELTERLLVPLGELDEALARCQGAAEEPPPPDGAAHG
jgi:tetratricopeptide (TPR) repeat protein/GTPase SAR1 family protein